MNDVEQRLAGMSRHEMRTVLLEILPLIHCGNLVGVEVVLREWNLLEESDDQEE